LNYLNGSIHHQSPQRKDENSPDCLTTVGPAPNCESSLSTPPIPVGSELTESDYGALEARWIDRALADRARLCRVDSLTGAQVVGRRPGNYAGILIPYFHPGSDRVREYRLRRDQPEYEYDSAGNLKPKQKYLSPPGRSSMLYLVPGVGRSLLADLELPIVITEGEFKTLALWRAAHHGSPHRPCFLPLGVPASTTGGEPSARPLAQMAAGWMSKVLFLISTGLHGRAAGLLLLTMRMRLRKRSCASPVPPWPHTCAPAVPSSGSWSGTSPKAKASTITWLCVGSDVVLDEIACVDFAGASWKKDLLRSKPIVNNMEGRILPVLANAIAAFRHAPEWGGVLAFNEFGLGTVVLKPAPWGVVLKGEWTDHEDRLAAEWLQRQGILVSVDVAGQAVQTAARDYPFHPVRTYLTGLQWDGVERVDRWLTSYLGADDTEYSRAVGSRWLISADLSARGEG
jgi:hypothetical protein